MDLRLEWVDNLKAFGIIVVILGHISSPYSTFIFSWHMPLFFFLGGFFINTKRNLINFASYNFTNLMLPYLLFMIVGIVIEIVKRLLLERPPLDYYNEIMSALFYIDISHMHHYGFVLWFLPTLLLGKIFLYISIKYLNPHISIIIAIAFSYLITIYNIRIPLAIDKAILSSFWIYNGYIYKHILSYKAKNIIFLLTLPIIYFGLTGHFIISLDIAHLFFSNLFINYLFSLSIILFLSLVFEKYLNLKINLINTWGSSTLFLFIIHPYTNNIAQLVSLHFFDNSWVISLLISILLLHLLLTIKSATTRYWST